TNSGSRAKLGAITLTATGRSMPPQPSSTPRQTSPIPPVAMSSTSRYRPRVGGATGLILSRSCEDCPLRVDVLTTYGSMSIPHEQIDPDAEKVVKRLTRNGFAAYLVGGCVRDLLLGRTPKDFDVATSATPQEIKALFRNCRIIGRRFRLAHIFFGSKI